MLPLTTECNTIHHFSTVSNVLTFVAMADMPNRLFELRRSKGWSQQQLATLVGCSKMHISGLERGTREFSLSMMRRIADRLDVEPAELLSREDNSQQLTEDERRLLETYRRAEPEKREDIQRVAAALAPTVENTRTAA